MVNHYDTIGKKYATIYNVLRVLEAAYEDGDFTKFVDLLTEDCVYESMWVVEPLCGREAVSRHLLGKGKSIKESESFPSCWIVELVGNMNPLPESDIIVNGEKKRATLALAYESGKFCLMLEQKLDGKTNEMLIDLKLTEDGMVSRMDLCMPELFNRNSMCPHVVFLPANGEGENKDALIRISDGYFSELSVFMGMAEENFDEYDDLVIPMENWVKTLDFWKTFVEAADYDAFVENAAGINYENWSVSNKDVMERLSWCGVSLWKRRKENAVMLDGDYCAKLREHALSKDRTILVIYLHVTAEENDEGETAFFVGRYNSKDDAPEVWEPAWIPVPGCGWANEEALAYIGEKGPGGNEWANQALFDYDGNALPALKTIRDF